MFEELQFKTEVHYPQANRRFLNEFLNDSQNENHWISEFKWKFDGEFPNWEPSKSYYYQYYPRAKKMLRSRLYSGMRDRIIVEDSLFAKMRRHLSLSPFIAFNNFIQFRETQVDVLNVFFNVDFLSSVDILSSSFVYRDNKKEKELLGLSAEDLIDMYHFTYFKDIEKSKQERRHLVVKRLIMCECFDIFTLHPFSSCVILSQKAIKFFETEGVSHIWPWHFDHFELIQK